MRTATYILFVMLQLNGPDPHNNYGSVPASVATSTAEFNSAEACRSAAEKAFATFGNGHVLVTTFCTEK